MPAQVYENKTVLDATIERVSFIFDNFENINVSISGGKDSEVAFHLMVLEAVRRNRKITIFFLDEEVMYQSTIDMIEYLISLYPTNISVNWLQIEFNLTNATSVKNGQLLCWEHGKHKEWMRPKKPFSIQHRMWDLDKQTVGDKNKGFGFYDVIDNYERCFENTAFIVGLRAVESPNRWRTMVKNPVNINGTKIYWATTKGNNIVLYPLYDWNAHDIWKYIHDAGLKYSKIYDYQFKKGYHINEMRVSSLIHEKSFKSICDLPEYEPKTYQRLLKRIGGISLAQETGKSAKLFKVQKLPKNFKSWVDYRDFLISTHLNKAQIEIFINRFNRQLNNEYVARQQCRQLVLNDYENNLPVINKPDPRQEIINYYKQIL